MTQIKKIRQSDGKVVDAIFSDDGKFVKTNIEGGYIVWADAKDPEILNLPVVSERTSKIRRAEHDLRKISEELEWRKRIEYPLGEPEIYLDEETMREGRRRERERTRK